MRPTSPIKSVTWSAWARRRICVVLFIDGREEKDIELAFGRFIELHGRAITDPACGCSAEVLPAVGGAAKVLTFWNERAAGDFLEFWTRYAAVRALRRGAAG